jgi:hypothetical protein
VFTLSESLDDECKVDKSEKDNVEFLEAGKNAPEAFQTTKEPLHFIPLLVQFTIIACGPFFLKPPSRRDALSLRWSPN